MALFYFIAALIFLGPLIAIISGVFYSIGLLGVINPTLRDGIGYLFRTSPVLIVIEVSFTLLTITLGSALGGELFDVVPETTEFWSFGRRR